jgi:hypothetical protein
LEEELRLPINEVFLWSDSQTALKYIANKSTQFQNFVANRTTKIHARTKVSQWRYVPSELNPSDILSRGCTVDELLKSSLWLWGPDFLKQDVGQLGVEAWNSMLMM